MLAGIRSRLTYANVVSTLCLFILLGAGAYAAGLAPNSVKSKHIKDGHVQNQDLANPAVNGSKVFPDTLGGEHIDESTLGAVPNATNAADAADAELLDGKDSSEFQPMGPQGWNSLDMNEGNNDDYPEEWCSWRATGAGFGPEYSRDQDGTVHLRGLVQARDGSRHECGETPALDIRIGTLLPGYRPGTRQVFTVTSANKPGRLDVTGDGDLVLGPNYPTFDDAKEWLSLDGISFSCWPSGQNGCP